MCGYAKNKIIWESVNVFNSSNSWQSSSLWKRRYRTQMNIMIPFFINIYCTTNANSKDFLLFIGLRKKLLSENVSGLTTSALLNDLRQTTTLLQRTLIFSPSFSLFHLSCYIHPHFPSPSCPRLLCKPTSDVYLSAIQNSTMLTKIFNAISLKRKKYLRPWNFRNNKTVISQFSL
jgi:hypothetical protein